jgi:carboxymethylenebutenolidase
LLAGACRRDHQLKQHPRWKLAGLARDALIDAGQREQIRTALAAAGVDHGLVSYPGVGHAFFWPGTPPFSRQAREHAWRRIVESIAS